MRNSGLTQSLSSWISRLLTNASSLQILDCDVESFPCPLSLGHPPLKHLSLRVAANYELMNSLESLSHCQHLESLNIVTVRSQYQIQRDTHPELPPIDLRGAPGLQHVQLVSFAPGKGQGLALPQGCALRLFAPAPAIQRWSESGAAGREAVTALFVWPREELVWTAPVPSPGPRTWPKGLDSFPALRFLELGGLGFNMGLDLRVFAQIPCIKLCTQMDLAMSVPKGAWELLELEGHGWKVSFADLHSFVRDVSVFAFTFSSDRSGFAEQLAEACRRADVPLHQQQHIKHDDRSDPRISEGMTKLSNNERFVEGLRLDSAVLAGVWQDVIVKAATAVLEPSR